MTMKEAQIRTELIASTLRTAGRGEADAVADLGEPEQIGAVFSGFQKYLYEPVARAEA